MTALLLQYIPTELHLHHEVSNEQFVFPPTVLPPSRNTPSPVDPEDIQIAVSYEPDPADLALSSVPGQEVFDPRKHKFSEEELKPQPMIKKARKVFISDDMKVTWVQLLSPPTEYVWSSFGGLTHVIFLFPGIAPVLLGLGLKDLPF